VFWERQLENTLSRLKREVHAPLRLVLWDGREVAFSDEARATIRLNDTHAAMALRRPSLLAFARAYIEGEADVEGDLKDVIDSAEAISRAVPPRRFASGMGQRHSRSDDREAIHHHYDVSNEFYALWLDPRMVYSCAYFRREDDTLEAAQVQKLDHICRKLRLAPGERFLDIGCGWGALVMHAAREYGVDATGITISENQHRLAHERIREAGLEGRCRVLLRDYRDVEGVFDKVASVGMFEHVGLANLSAYFGVVRRVLREQGLFLNHGITSSDTLSREVGLGAGEFIDTYVFPKGELPHLHRVILEMSKQDLEVHDVECLRPHYAKTLGRWSAVFEQRLKEASAAAGERTTRIWRIYLAGCAHAFDQGWISVYQVLATRREVPGPTSLPLTRDWMYSQ
jgi:cyclopropane-fatty-acyl-phospholipid synthase